MPSNLEIDRLFAIDVVQQLRDAGYEALWAGGCVRDLLLGDPPADYDVATSATPQQVRELFGRRRTLAIGESFGVIVVLPPRKSNRGDRAQSSSDDRRLSKANQIEVATFRTDGGYSDGRRPDSVLFSSATEDALRRDFTINGMFYDPLAEEVRDYVGGQEDLQAGVIRAIGNPEDRIAEDKLRMLRAIRFAVRFNFQLDEQTRQAIADHASEIDVVSGERISIEVQKSLATSQASWAVRQWQELGLLSGILPSVDLDWEMESPEALSVLDTIPAGSWQCKLACLLYFSSGEELRSAVSDLKAHLKLSNADSGMIEFALKAQPALENARQNTWSQVQPVLIHPHVSAALELLTARIEAGTVKVPPELMEWLLEKSNQPDLDPAPLLQGQDLMDQGLKPGPQFKSILELARQMQLDNELQSREAALHWLQSLEP